jgi:hypothetical protein
VVVPQPGTARPKTEHGLKYVMSTIRVPQIVQIRKKGKKFSIQQEHKAHIDYTPMFWKLAMANKHQSTIEGPNTTALRKMQDVHIPMRSTGSIICIDRWHGVIPVLCSLMTSQTLNRQCSSSEKNIDEREGSSDAAVGC